MLLNPTEATTLWLAALRYYLGRTTYAVGDFCDLLRAQWTELPASLHALIQRDVEEAFTRDDEDRANARPNPRLGMDMDRHEWLNVRKLWRAQ